MEEKKAIRSHILRRNLRLWGGGAFRMQAMILTITVVYTLVMSGFTLDVFREKEMVTGYFVMVELIGFFLVQAEYTGKQLALALSFGSGRMESVWGMQFSNALYLMLASTLCGMLVHSGMGMLLFFGCGVLVLALGQFMVALYLKKGSRMGAGRIIYAVFASFFTVVLGLVFQGVIRADAMRAMGLKQQVMCGLLVVASLPGIVLYIIGFFMERRYIKEFVVR